MQEARSSFFQRQFCSALKLFRNLLSWQGILADNALKDLAILSLLNRYLLSAMRVYYFEAIQNPQICLILDNYNFLGLYAV